MMSVNYTVKITSQAYENLREITKYISHNLHAPDAAVTLLDKIYKKAEALAYMPERIALIEEEPWRSEGIRKISVDNFYMYFWVDKSNMLVQIIAVIYSRRDQMHQLADIMHLK